MISLSSAFAHGIITNGNPKHLCYVHSPARYLWDRTHDVLDRVKKATTGSLRRRYLEKVSSPPRLGYGNCRTAGHAACGLEGSAETHPALLEAESNVPYPLFDDFWFQAPLKPETRNQKPKTYLVASTLVPYKRIDLAIEACNKRGLKLRIVGEGPDEALLRKSPGQPLNSEDTNREKIFDPNSRMPPPSSSRARRISVSSHSKR